MNHNSNDNERIKKDESHNNEKIDEGSDSDYNLDEEDEEINKDILLDVYLLHNSDTDVNVKIGAPTNQEDE